MTNITKRGERLAWSLNRWMGTTREIQETCSLIARHGMTYGRIQEVWCSRELSDHQTRWFESREETLERQIARLVESLPAPSDESGVLAPVVVEFEGDPRGWTVRLVVTDHRGARYEYGCDE
jgi:hypothetical protein